MIQHCAPTYRELEDTIASLVDTGAEMRIGLPVHARYGGLAYYYPGTIYQVRISSLHVARTCLICINVLCIASILQINPTEYSTPTGPKWYPKGTFGILYDDGDVEPAVPLSMLRIIQLKVREECV